MPNEIEAATAASEPVCVMPAEIAKAVIAVMASVKKLGKEGNNTFQRYKFTSVDQFYEALGPLMASHGLMDIALERSVSVEVREVADDRGTIKKSAWLMAVFDFWLFHESGAFYGPINRTQQVQATGAQSYAAAQSFAEKYFLRNLFKIPTGDVDEVDASQQVGLPDTAVINDSQYEALSTEITAQGGGLIEPFLKIFKIASLSDLPASRYDEAMARLKKRREDAAAVKKAGDNS